MQYIEAPNYYEIVDKSTLFLAGGITGCPDWQQEVVNMLKDEDIAILNPRRANFPINDPSAAREQIEWEFHSLRNAHRILFWFPCESICPITLFELGAHAHSHYTLSPFVGIHPNYKRKQDVEIQLALLREPNTPIVYSLDDLVNQVKEWLKHATTK